MAWLAAIVVLVLLVVSAGFRKFAGVALALCVLVGLYFYFQNEQEKSESVSRIAASELGLDGLTLIPEYGSYKLKGRVTNRSPKYALSSLTLKISMEDCTGEGDKRSCVTIAENAEFIFLSIPPQQARDLNESVYFPGGAPAPKGALSWHYNITEIKASDAT